jgi:hypothetical protein
MDKYALRRHRLQQLVDERAGGNKAAFGRMYDYDRAQVSQFLSTTYNGGNSMGEKAVSEMERRLGLEPGWFDRPIRDEGWPFKLVTAEEVRALDPKSLAELDAAISFWVRAKIPTGSSPSNPYIDESGTILHGETNNNSSPRSNPEGKNARESTSIPKTSQR